MPKERAKTIKRIHKENEKNLSTKKEKKTKSAWIPCKNENISWKASAEASS